MNRSDPVNRVEAIERATLEAVAPETVEELPGWLLPFASGTIRRAHSAVPLRHDGLDRSILPLIEARYLQRGMRPVFRLANDPRIEEIAAELRRRRYSPEQPTLVQISPTASVAAVSLDPPGELISFPDEAWRLAFTDGSRDATDGAARISALCSAKDAVFGLVREHGDTVAVGVASFGFGWASVHGMRTRRACRNRGLAARVLAALAGAAAGRGFDRIFLQVDEDNGPARSLYARAGFRTEWSYRYWSAMRAE